MRPVSPEAAVVYEFIEKHYRLNGLFPPFREIMAGCQLSSVSVVRYRVEALIRRGWLLQESRGGRAFTLLKEPKTYYIRKESESDTNISNIDS